MAETNTVASVDCARQSGEPREIVTRQHKRSNLRTRQDPHTGR